jgi:hypothetical protein
MLAYSLRRTGFSIQKVAQRDPLRGHHTVLTAAYAGMLFRGVRNAIAALLRRIPVAQGDIVVQALRRYRQARQAERRGKRSMLSDTEADHRARTA